MILHREVRQQNRQINGFEAPSWFAHDKVAQRYEAMFAEFDWTEVPEVDEQSKRVGRLPHPARAYLRSYLVMVQEKIESMPKLREYLCEHPALVWLLEYRLVADADSPEGFDVQGSVPSAGHLGVKLGQLETAHLSSLLRQSAQRVLQADVQPMATLVVDVKHQYAYVRQNNLRHVQPERFNPARQPRGDVDCRLGFKPCSNQAHEQHATTKQEQGSYLWGYGTGIAVLRTSSREAVVLAEQTQPFNVSDVEYAPLLLDKAIQVLQGLPACFTADAAFDAQAVYAYFVGSASSLAIPLNLRGKPRFALNAEGDVLCPADASPMQALERWQERGQARQRFRCPSCGHEHKLFVETVNLYRWQIAHEGPSFRRLYRQRTIVERVNSLADAYKLTRPRQRRLRSVARRNTLIYIVLNYHVLQRLRRQHQESMKTSLQPAAA